MRTLAVDGGMGASGDMLLGALLAAGADPAVLSPVTDALPVKYRIERVQKAGIEATSVSVETDEGPAEGHGPARTLAEIEAIVDGMALSEAVAADARATFELLARAEAAVHGTDVAATHVHEVGADDAIADVVGTLLLAADLGVERWVVPPVRVGRGEVTMAHGTYPVPPPAVVEIAERADWQIAGGPVDGELLTPTGAALLAHLGAGVEAVPAMAVDAVGYGAGSREYPDRPNVLRATIGETDAEADGEAALELEREPIAVVETTVDDATPEVLGRLQETLPAAGALDVSILPTTMKKSRPGHLVQAIATPGDARAVAAKLAEETGSLGVRVDERYRWIADRAVVEATVEIDGERHAVGVKVATDATGERFDASAEFDNVARVADATGVPLREVAAMAERAARQISRSDR